MKNLFKTALLILVVQLANAQKIEIGVKGGLSLSSVSNFDVLNFLGQDLKYRAAGGGGVFAEIPLGTQFSFRPEVSYSRRGTKLAGLNLSGLNLGGLGTLLGGISNARLDLDYIDIPLLAKYKFSESGVAKPYIVAGPVLSFMVGHQMNNNILSIIDFTYNADLNYNKVDIGGMLGAGVEFPVGKVKGFVEASYMRGFTNMVDNLGIVKVSSKNNSFGLQAGLAFPIGK